MKRFWKQAAAVESDGGWAVELDRKPVRTPARSSLVVPGRALAEAIADEWNACATALDPRAMPLTGLANAAIDRVAPNPAAFAEALARYAESDLLCYRSETPRELRSREEAQWDALLAWARRRFDVDFATTCGIVPVAQPEAAVRRLSAMVASLDPFRLAGLSPLVTIGGSLVAALAVAEGQMKPATAWEAVTVDEQWQAEQWGEDAEAKVRLVARERDFLAAARFLSLLPA